MLDEGDPLTDMGATATMSPPRKNPKPKGRPKGDTRMRSIASFKGSDEFAEWFDKLADHCRDTASALIEKSLVAYAKQQGFTVAAPKR